MTQDTAALQARVRELEARVAELEAKLRREQSATPTDVGTLWQATKAAYEECRQKTLRWGGIVKVPDLVDAAMRTAQGLTREALHGLLQQWQQEDRLTLQLCNDPRLEPRAAEGIRTDRGLRFYVQLRP